MNNTLISEMATPRIYMQITKKVFFKCDIKLIIYVIQISIRCL